jgi:hypothetical protein
VQLERLIEAYRNHELRERTTTSKGLSFS